MKNIEQALPSYGLLERPRSSVEKSRQKRSKKETSTLVTISAYQFRRSCEGSDSYHSCFLPALQQQLFSSLDFSLMLSVHFVNRWILARRFAYALVRCGMQPPIWRQLLLMRPTWQSLESTIASDVFWTLLVVSFGKGQPITATSTGLRLWIYSTILLKAGAARSWRANAPIFWVYDTENRILRWRAVRSRGHSSHEPGSKSLLFPPLVPCFFHSSVDNKHERSKLRLS